MFAGLGVKARGTVNSLTKRNVDFDRPAPAENDLTEVLTVAVGEVDGPPEPAAKISGYLAEHLGSSGRFALAAADGAPEEAASASIKGSIVEAQYSEREDSQSAKCGDKTCVTRTRIGTAVVSVNLSLVDPSGRVLVQKNLEERREAKTSARDNTPPSIDGGALLDEAARKVSADFFAVVSPHAVSETVFFETDNEAKALKEGANRALNGDLAGAIAAFEQGLEQAQAKADDKAIAKARYDLGLALVIDGKYEEGLALLEQAQRPKSNQNWASTVLAVKRWKTDAERAGAQWAVNDVHAPPIEPALRPSEEATAEGAKVLKTLRAGVGG